MILCLDETGGTSLTKDGFSFCPRRVYEAGTHALSFDFAARANAGQTAATSAAGTTRSGIYEAWPETIDGAVDLRRYAINVNAEESDLAIAATQTLLTRLEPVKIEFRTADQYAFEFSDQAGVNRSLLLMVFLITLLLGEQVLAYLASYHTAQGAVRT